ncbi:MAG: hypothetical protein AAF085_14115, partial [Planctomycetota bacterium]
MWNKTIPAMALALITASVASASTVILVDYDDGLVNGIHDAAVRNGGFEGPTSAIDGRTFDQTDNWINIQGDQAAQARRTNINDTG